MFDDNVIRQLVFDARKDNIEPPSLFAIVQTESDGRAFESDGVTPCLLFERHMFYKILKQKHPEKLAEAVEKGLAIPNRRDGQYQDQGTSSGRMRLLAAARAIDIECADEACSWGLGQILGNNAQDLGYESAADMVATMQGKNIVPQVDAMRRFIRKNRLIPYLNMHQWDTFALHYNGPAYRSNNYATKMATYYNAWAKRLDTMSVPPPAEAPAPAPEPEEPDELPPPYIEPKTAAKSKTLWSTAVQMLSAGGAYIGTMLGDWRILVACLAVIVFLALFIGRERILKIIETNT